MLEICSWLAEEGLTNVNKSIVEGVGWKAFVPQQLPRLGCRSDLVAALSCDLSWLDEASPELMQQDTLLARVLAQERSGCVYNRSSERSSAQRESRHPGGRQNNHDKRESDEIRILEGKTRNYRDARGSEISPGNESTGAR